MSVVRSVRLRNGCGDPGLIRTMRIPFAIADELESVRA